MPSLSITVGTCASQFIAVQPSAHSSNVKGRSIDSINMSDDMMEDIFVSKRARERLLKGLTFPPQHCRRTVGQIKDWFNEMGGAGRTELIEKEDIWDIDIHYNASLQWKDREWIDPTTQQSNDQLKTPSMEHYSPP